MSVADRLVALFDKGSRAFWLEKVELVQDVRRLQDENATMRVALKVTAENIERLAASANCTTYDEWLSAVNAALPA